MVAIPGMKRTNGLIIGLKYLTWNFSTATGNTISTFDPVYAAYLKDVLSKMPAPNGGASSPNKLVSSFPGVFNYREELIRVDQVINAPPIDPRRTNVHGDREFACRTST